MYIIAHRGNLNGINQKCENDPSYLQKAIDLNFFVETDIWHINNKFFLGHDKPDYLIDYEWIEKRSKYLWLHAKNIEALEMLYLNKKLNVFWHETHKVTITSKGFLWLYPGNYSKNGITVILDKPENKKISNIFGVCSDYALSWRNL